jgi:hypothetical protein
VVKNPDGSISVAGQKLPPGVKVSENADGSLRLEGAEGLAGGLPLPAGLAVRTAPDGSLLIAPAAAADHHLTGCHVRLAVVNPQLIFSAEWRIFSQMAANFLYGCQFFPLISSYCILYA